MAAKVRRDAKGVYWVVIHYEGRRVKKRVGRDRRLAEQVAKKLQAKLVLGELKSDPPKEATVPFGPSPSSGCVAKWNCRSSGAPKII